MKKKERRGDERLGKPERREGWKCGEREREREERVQPDWSSESL